MKLSTNFLKDYVDIDVDVKTLAEDIVDASTGEILIPEGTTVAEEHIDLIYNTKNVLKEFISKKLINSTTKKNITDSNGNCQWAYKVYNKGLRLKYEPGWYNVKVKFDGDKIYKSASGSNNVTVKTISSGFDAYNYYDNHNWGLNQEIDDYIEYNYWDEEIYDDASNYDGEGY